MGDVSFLDKIKFLVKFGIKRVTSTLKGPYTKVILGDNIEKSKEHCDILNSSYIDVYEPFDNKNKVIIWYQGEKNFCTLLKTESYTSIDKSIKDILTNYSNFPKKSFDKDNVMIDKVFFVTIDDQEIEFFELMTLFIEYDDIITIGDIVYLFDKDHSHINFIKISYYEDFELKMKEIDFHEIKNDNIESIIDFI
jgi:hypothetical protein